MVKQLTSKDIKDYLATGSNKVLLDVRTKEELDSVGKPDGDKMGLTTYFLEIKRNSFFDFTKELPVLRVAHKSKAGTKTHSFHFPEKMEDTQSVIYDVKTDQGQTKPITDKNVLERLNQEMMRLIYENDAPKETIFEKRVAYFIKKRFCWSPNNLPKYNFFH